jgi:hypothetical protein
MTKQSKKYSPWRTRAAIVATGFAAFGAFTVAKAEAVTPSVSVFNVHMSEGNAGSKLMPFSVKLSMASPGAQWVQLQPGVGGTTPATANTDFNAGGPYLVNFAPGETAKVVNIPIKGDTIDEYDETFVLKVVAHGPGVTVADGEGQGSITDDDAAPFLSINDVAKNEGTGGITPFTFTAKLSAASQKTVKVNAVGQSNSAHIPEDLTAGPATLTFNPGVTARTYTAHVNGDTVGEAHETFRILLDSASHATIADGSGAGTITNDDAFVVNPVPQPQPQPQPDPGNGGGNGGGGNSGGGVSGSNGGGFVASAPDAPAGDVSVAGEGEQALGPNAAADARPVHKSIDGMTAALLILLGACALGLIAVTFVIARNRRDQRDVTS